MKPSRTSGLPWSLDRQVRTSDFDRNKWLERQAPPDGNPGQATFFKPPDVHELWAMGEDFNYHYPEQRHRDIAELALASEEYRAELEAELEAMNDWLYEARSERAYNRDDRPYYTEDPAQAEEVWRTNGYLGDLDGGVVYNYEEGVPFNWDAARHTMERADEQFYEWATGEGAEEFPQDQWHWWLYQNAINPSWRHGSKKVAMPLSPDSPGLPQVYYHASPASNHENIMAGGLIPGAGPSPWMKRRQDGVLPEAPYGVYLWDDPENAIGYAHTLADQDGVLKENKEEYIDSNPEWFMGDYDEEADDWGEPSEKPPAYNVYAIRAEDLPAVHMDPENALMPRPKHVYESDKGYGEISFDQAMKQYDKGYNPQHDEYDGDRSDGHRYYSPDPVPASALTLHQSIPVTEMDNNSWFEDRDFQKVPEPFTRVPDLMNSPLADPNWKRGAFDRNVWEQMQPDYMHTKPNEQMSISGCPKCGGEVYGDYGYDEYDLENPQWKCEKCGYEWPEYDYRNQGWKEGTPEQAQITKAVEGPPEIDYEYYLGNYLFSQGVYRDSSPTYDSTDVKSLYDIAVNRGELSDLIDAINVWREEIYEQENELIEINHDYLNEGRPDYDEDPEGEESWYDSAEYKWRYDDLINEHLPQLKALGEFDKLLEPHRRTAAQFEESEPCPHCMKVDSYGLDELPGVRACRSCGMAWRVDPVTRTETPKPNFNRPTENPSNLELTQWAQNYHPTSKVEGSNSKADLDEGNCDEVSLPM